MSIFKRFLSLIVLSTACLSFCRTPVAAGELELLDLADPDRGARNREEEMFDQYGAYWKVQLDGSWAHREAITGFYLQLLENYDEKETMRNGGVMKGVVMRTACDVNYITRLNLKTRHAPFVSNWSAEMIVAYEFGMVQSNGFSLGLNGGYATSVDSINVSARRVVVGVAINWYAQSRKLEVEVWDLDDPRDTGEQFLEGRYFVTGKSVNSTLSTKQDLALSYSLTAQPKKDPSDTTTTGDSKSPPKQTIGITGSSYMDSGKKRMRVVTAGCSCLLAYGRFQWIETPRADGTLKIDITFDAEFNSDIEMQTQQTLQAKSAECEGQRSISGSVSFSDLVTDAQAAVSNSVKCGVAVTAVPYDVEWTIRPTLDRNKPDSEQEEGMKSQVRWCVDTNSNTSWYQPRFRNGLTYKFSATAANGVSSASILIKSDATDMRQTKKYLTTSWK